MSAPINAPANDVPTDHDVLCTRVGTVVAMQLADLMPRIVQQLQGGQPGGLVARIGFRPQHDQAGPPVLMDIEFSTVGGPAEVLALVPSATVAGQLALRDHPAMNPVDQYPSAQEKQPPPELVPQPEGAVPTPRYAADPPPQDWVQPAAQVGLNGPLPAEQAPSPSPESLRHAEWLAQQGGVAPNQATPPQQPAPPLDPQQYALWYAQEHAARSAEQQGVAPPAPQAPPKPRPGRIQRPPMVSDAGIRTNLTPR